MSKRIGNSPFIYDDAGIKVLGVSSDDGTISTLIESYPTVLAIPSGFTGVAQVGTQLYVGDGVSLAIIDKTLSNVGYRCMLPNTNVPSNKYISSSIKEFAPDSLVDMSLVYWNGWLSGGAPYENLNTFPTVYRSRIIDANNNILASVTWGGAATGTAAAGAVITSDVMRLARPIKKGEAYFIQTTSFSSGGLIYTDACSSANSTGTSTDASGEWFLYSSNTPLAIGDNLAPGSIINPGTFRPCAVLSSTNVKSLALIGDSRTNGQAAYSCIDGYGIYGDACNLLGMQFPMINMAVSGSFLANFTAITTPVRKTIGSMCSGILITGGINDLRAAYGNKNLAAMKTILGVIASIFPSVPKFLQTVYAAPTASTDAWVSDLNQTSDANDAQRIAYNTAIKLLQIPNYSGYLDVASYIDSTTNSGHVKGGYTSDGVHANLTANTVLLNAPKSHLVQLKCG